MATSGGPRWLREGAVTIVWSAAAVNVFIVTWKTMVGVYKPGPLSGKSELGSGSKEKEVVPEKSEIEIIQGETKILKKVLKSKEIIPDKSKVELFPGETSFLKKLFGGS
jgi:hypothetical protein